MAVLDRHKDDYLRFFDQLSEDIKAYVKGECESLSAHEKKRKVIAEKAAKDRDKALIDTMAQQQAQLQNPGT